MYKTELEVRHAYIVCYTHVYMYDVCFQNNRILFNIECVLRVAYIINNYMNTGKYKKRLQLLDYN